MMDEFASITGMQKQAIRGRAASQVPNRLEIQVTPQHYITQRKRHHNTTSHSTKHATTPHHTEHNITLQHHRTAHNRTAEHITAHTITGHAAGRLAPHYIQGAICECAAQGLTPSRIALCSAAMPASNPC